MHLYACMVAREFPLQSLLRLRPELREGAVAVLDGEPPGEQVCSMNGQARAMGVTLGTTKIETIVFPGVLTLSRSPAQETAARQALLECAGGFSPLVEYQSDDRFFICVADITGTEKLFGPPAVVAEKMRNHALALQIEVSIAVSSNFHASLSLALGCPGVHVIPCGMERKALSPLPLSVLALSGEHAETFSMWGIHTLGELANLDETALIVRLGQEGKRLRLLARGEAPHLFRSIEPVLRLEERMELDAPVEIIDSLLFVAGVMLDQLIVRTRARILALAAITLALGLENETVHTRTVRPSIPTIDRQLWLKLIHLDLQAHPPAAGIRSLLLEGEPGTTGKAQLGLFSPQSPEPMRLDLTLARIRSIVGDDCVGSAVLNDTHRPDSFRMESFHVPSGSSASAKKNTASHAQRMAMRQLRPAESVPVTLQGGKPKTFTFRDKRYQVEQAYGPWSSSGDWWKPELWAVEQWDLVARGDNCWICCCLVHDLSMNGWRIEALYD
jgi:protein ImuB